MNEDLPSRLELLHVARRVLVQQATSGLAQIDRWIEDEERREAERRQLEARKSPPPEWLLQYGLNRRNVDSVHAGDCWVAARRAGRRRSMRCGSRCQRSRSAVRTRRSVSWTRCAVA